MSKALVLGAAALVFSAASASAQDDYGYDEPVADLAAPADGYAAPLAPPVYTTPPPVYAAPVYPAPLVAPPVYYAAPVYTPPPTVYVVPAPVYTAPGYHPAPVGSRDHLSDRWRFSILVTRPAFSKFESYQAALSSL